MIPAFLLPYAAPIVGRLIPYKTVIIGMAVVAVVVAIDRRATYRERARCDAASVRAELAQVRRDLKIQTDTADYVKQQLAEARTREDDLDKKVSTYVDELAKRPTVCRVPEPDRKRLLRIK